MEPGPLRRLATMGMLAIIACLVMYLFAAKQVTDTETPRVAQMVHRVLERNLEEGSKTTLKLASRRQDGFRHYVLTMQPVERVGGDPAALRKLLASAANVAVGELGSSKRELALTCVALLPGGEERVTYDRRMQKIPEPEPVAAPDAGPAE